MKRIGYILAARIRGPLALGPGGTITVADATPSVGAIFGAIVCAGGIGVGGPSVFGSTVRVQGGVILNNTLNVAGQLVSGGGIICNSTLNVAGNATFGGAATHLVNGIARFGHSDIYMRQLPVAAAGLASGQLWANANVINIIP